MKSSLIFSMQEIRSRDGLSLRESVEASDIAVGDLPARVLSPLRLELDFSVGGSRVLLSGQFDGQWELECSRCLRPFRAAFRGLLEETYPFETSEIDAAEEVRQGLVLALPPKPLCAEACRGLCPQCGKNLNDGACACRVDNPSPFAKLKRK